jgi:hypothetical protein
MEAITAPLRHARVRVLHHIRKLDDALGHFLVQISCKCGMRHIAEPKHLHDFVAAQQLSRLSASACDARSAAPKALKLWLFRFRDRAEEVARHLEPGTNCPR